MNPDIIDQLKRNLTRLSPSMEFGPYLGEGSFSVVYSATVRGVPCAIKVSKKPWAHDPAVYKERKSLLDLMLECNGHPHVVTLIEYWDGDDVDGHLITRWELGKQSLAGRLEECQNQGLPGIPRDELLDYMRHAADGLDFINGRGIVHRDVKPENLLLFHGQVKIIDFGFARLAELDSQTNSVLGTPVYTPPEAFDKRLQPSVDIYCLAGTYIRLRTGQFPFGTDADEIRRRKRAGDFLCHGLDAAEIDALRPALVGESVNRVYPSAGALATALDLEQSSPRDMAPTRTTTSNPTYRPSFQDKIRIIVEREGGVATETERIADQRQRFRQLCEQQFDAGEFVLCWGTVNWLLLQDPDDAELLELRKFLDTPAPGSIWPRGANSVGGYVTLIPDGEFLMGSPVEEVGHRDNEFQHQIHISEPFYMGIYPVTVGEFSRFFMGKKRGGAKGKEGVWGWIRGKVNQPNDQWKTPGFHQMEDHPVVRVSWHDAEAFCAWLGRKENKSYRLPTEAEWEWACRGGTGQDAAFGIGDGKTLTSKQANFNGEYVYNGGEKGPNLKRTTPVGSYGVANGFGLYDMHGNVWEWCQDWFGRDYYRESPAEDPKGPDKGDGRVRRGGGWTLTAFHERCASREAYDPLNRSPSTGFRLAVGMSTTHN